MSEYFDQLEREVRAAVRAQTHLRWYTRFRLRHTRALIASLAVLVIATPAVAAVSGVFGPGRPDPFYPQAKTSGSGQATSGTRILPMRVPDPDGGPPWGLRLVKTTREDTCVQVGRVEYGELGSLGIDYSWDNDHLFHPINPDEAPADICGATDAAGHGFVSSDWEATASAYTPSDSGTGVGSSYCQGTSSLARLRSMLNALPRGSASRTNLAATLRRQEAAAARVHTCPAGSWRMIFVGLLGPDARSITYRTPTGATKTEDTVGGVGAYLIVLKQTPANCAVYAKSLTYDGDDCEDNYGGTQNPALQLPNAVTSVTYADGRTCSDEPTARFVSLFDEYQAVADQSGNAKQARARFARFLTAHHLSTQEWTEGIMPQCSPVGFITPEQAKITTAQVSSPIRVRVVEAERFCTNAPPRSRNQGTLIACPGAVPTGYRRVSYLPAGARPTEQALITASFTARQPVTSSNSWYEWQIQDPGNRGGQGSQTEADVHRGRRIYFSLFETAHRTGVYHGTVAYMQNAGQSGPEGGEDPGHDGSIVVGTFSFRLAVPPHSSRSGPRSSASP